MKVNIKTKAEIEILKNGGKHLNHAINIVSKEVKPGITTLELDQIFRKEIQKIHGQPSFLGYRGYPNALCVSVNSQVVHGIPGKYIIRDGDVVSLDGGLIYQGLFTDMAKTVAVGKVSKTIQQLIVRTEKALYAGINAAKAGNFLGDISAAIEKIAIRYNYGVVRDLTGHGVGYAVHEEPAIPNFGPAHTGIKLQKGMILAIEPMFCLGDFHVQIAPDNWTVETVDQSISAHAEHTIVVEKDQAKIITLDK